MKDDLSDDPQAARVDLVERVLPSVPVARLAVAVIEIDQVDGGNPGFEKGQVVIRHPVALVGEVALVAQVACRLPDGVDQPARRVLLARNDQVPVADHIEQHHRFDAGDLSASPQRGDHLPTAVGIVLPVETVAPAGTEGLFAIEEGQSVGEVVLPLLGCQDPGQFEQDASAGTAIVGPDEWEVLERLGVVVAGDDDDLGRLAGQIDHQVLHPHPSLRGHGGKGFDPRLQSVLAQFPQQVLPRLLDSGRTGGTWPNCHQRFDVSVGALAIERGTGFARGEREGKGGRGAHGRHSGEGRIPRQPDEGPVHQDESGDRQWEKEPMHRNPSAERLTDGWQLSPRDLVDRNP